MDGFNVQLEAAEERISQLEDGAKEMTENAVLREKKMQIIRERLKEMEGAIIVSMIHLIGFPSRMEYRENGGEAIFSVKC